MKQLGTYILIEATADTSPPATESRGVDHASTLLDRWQPEQSSPTFLSRSRLLGGDLDVLVLDPKGQIVFIESKWGERVIGRSVRYIGQAGPPGFILLANALLGDTGLQLGEREISEGWGSATLPPREPVSTEYLVEEEVRLVPPTIEYRSLPARLLFLGEEKPRVFYDPERD